MNCRTGFSGKTIGHEWFRVNKGEGYVPQRRKSTVVPDILLMKSVQAMLKNINKRRRSCKISTPPKKNPYIERIRSQSVEHPLENVPGFCRLDMITQKGKSFLPDLKIEANNDLLNPNVMKLFFEKVFHNDSVNFLHNKIKDLKKKQRERLQKIEMAFTLKPNIKKSELFRANSMRKFKREITRLSGMIEVLEGKNPFKDGAFGRIVSKIHHQEFFKTNFKLESINSQFKDLSDKQKLLLLDWVIERFYEVDLEKQKQFICDNRKINKVYISKDSLNQNPLREKSLPNKKFFMKRRQKISDDKASDFNSVSDSEDIESKEFELSLQPTLFSMKFTKDKIKFNKKSKIKSKALYVRRTPVEKETERYQDYEVNKINSDIKDIIIKE
ncbi:unnamed protein product [Moneuplotes crassus]|uniref:Uncharacterized protein n=1 Tax=Euplotes crassus TaxID=5936 RepID=A0AAD1UB09_EUPCR|nr:unnamed protein product [Moneuplotes crassus]